MYVAYLCAQKYDLNEKGDLQSAPAKPLLNLRNEPNYVLHQRCFETPRSHDFLPSRLPKAVFPRWCSAKSRVSVNKKYGFRKNSPLQYNKL